MIFIDARATQWVAHLLCHCPAATPTARMPEAPADGVFLPANDFRAPGSPESPGPQIRRSADPWDARRDITIWKCARDLRHARAAEPLCARCFVAITVGAPQQLRKINVAVCTIRSENT